MVENIGSNQVIIKENGPLFMLPVIQQLFKNYAEYSNKYKNDALYWYNERTNVGALAGAIWQQHGMALEEYGAKKESPETKWQGRVDLFFTIKDKDILSECKMQWVRCPFKSDGAILKTVETKIKKACKDTEYSIMDKAYCGLPLVFVTPIINKIKYDVKHIMRLKTILQTIGTDLFASYLHEGDNIVSNRGNVCNAVFILGKYINIPHNTAV